MNTHIATTPTQLTEAEKLAIGKRINAHMELICEHALLHGDSPYLTPERLEWFVK
jgi:hypothetical protein